MKKGDLYYLMHIPETKALVVDIYNKRKFHQTKAFSHFNDFPAISIIPCVRILVVSGKYKGEKETYTVSDFNSYYRKIEVEDESR